MRSATQEVLRFDGPPETVRPPDAERLGRQLDAVRKLMSDGTWRTLRVISLHTGASEAGASARLRDLRKPRFGGYVVSRRRVRGTLALFEYQVLKPGACHV